MAQLLFWIVIAVSVALLVAAFVRLKRERQMTGYDFLTVLLPFVLWWTLAITGWKTKSLSNLIEPLSLVVLVPLLFSARAFAVSYSTNHARSVGAFALSLLLAGGLYVFVPVLPE
ncbi:hypothetical protein FGKAn22_11330 [Ferrigenium kumadai]|uniref:Uncharacterized protein n=1 Tax=Ferrigenium kumadai TaxID=1682490 RepID=A0AAN1VZJ4_9PROT|nr:hypothetical protein [Ferrigenium kumadai]BBI99440.1 hypothetical protein FGKAn22_11330 [Ferrigenium kumadai]